MTHLFELSSHKLKYSFFTYNCASGINRVLAVASDSLKMEQSSIYVTPIEYAKYIANESGRLKSITVRPSNYDKKALDNNSPLNPLLSPKTTRFGLDYKRDNDGFKGLEMSFLPIISDIKEDISYKNTLNESKFGQIIADFSSKHSFVKDFIFVNIKSLPNILDDNLKPSFGFALHGDVDVKHSSLYPDLHLGTGFSLGNAIVRPFYSIDFGAYCQSNGMNYYVKNSIGTIFTNNPFGRVYLSYSNIYSSKNTYRGYKNSYDFGYSKRLSKDLWLKAEVQLYDLKKKGNYTNLLAGIYYRAEF